MAKRSNPKRSVPHAPRLPEEHVSEGRHRKPSEFLAHRKGRGARTPEAANVARMDQRGRARGDFERMSKQVTPTRNRRKKRVSGGEGGAWPDAAAEERRDPKPPAILVLYPDMVEVLGPEPIYGQYPRGFIEKMLPWMNCQRHEILHLCSGCLPKGEGIRVDIRPAARPDILADVTALPLADNSVAAVMADPPYSPAYAKSLYGVKYPRPNAILAEAVRVVRPGGSIVFVHYITPAPPPGAEFVKAWAASTGLDMPVRAVTLYRKDQQQLALLPEAS